MSQAVTTYISYNLILFYQQMKAVKYMMAETVTSGFKERLKSFDSKFEIVNEQINFIFREIDYLSRYFICRLIYFL